MANMAGSSLWCVLALGAVFVAAQQGNVSTAHTVDEFVRSLMDMINSAISTDARYAQFSTANAVADNSISRPNQRPLESQSFQPGGRPLKFLDYLQGLQNLQNQPYAPTDFAQPGFAPNGRPYPPPDFAQNGGGPVPGFAPQPGGPFPPLGRPPYPPPQQQHGRPPPYPYPYPNRPGQYPQSNSVLQALASISQHDDLRCVPRLLCEVSSGTRSSNYYRPSYQQQQGQSSIPFLTRDALITLLTVLNFVDDSPLLMFGRAALLGYNSRNDPRSCLAAYPTCPRDPDRLIDYLNNHNGGFFRFFNQQIPQYAPQYAQQYNAYKTRADKELRPRILSGQPSQYYEVPSAYDLPLQSATNKPAVFPDYINGGTYANSYVSQFKFPSNHRRGKKLTEPAKMIFPDRTGTGGLRADLDQYGNYKGAYYDAETVKFQDQGHGASSNKMKFPDEFEVGNRTPYSKKHKLKFPSQDQRV
ncbi:uncharacterized protein LOC126842836 [Adelges cooleyi]|uniref:uncharacterized protein LOC126842836 n=1 Tax=Adelges cooleyi TaxID=133065 RepID=UPI00217F4755|nr:uncharacterized protein LOC126842836 [Adelges cooleyi]XP_050435978.1 uncharacterized protein LOC126842836 [Adelges cooleyi]